MCPSPVGSPHTRPTKTLRAPPTSLSGRSACKGPAQWERQVARGSALPARQWVEEGSEALPSVMPMRGTPQTTSADAMAFELWGSEVARVGPAGSRGGTCWRTGGMPKGRGLERASEEACLALCTCSPPTRGTEAKAGRSWEVP